jgi:predicted dehydrogenase
VNPEAKLRAIVVGLGRIGSRFDEERGRRTVWTHAGAYSALADRFELAGACELDAGARNKFAQRFPTVPTYGQLEEVIAATAPDVASICTPPDTHREVLDVLLRAPGLRVVWCEKPMSATLVDAEDMRRAAEAHGVTLVVSHVRRWTPLWQRARALVAGGAVGKVRCIRVAMPNRLWSIGSHAVDLLLFLGGPYAEVQPFAIPALDEEGEPAIAAFFTFTNGAYGLLQLNGMKRALMVEAEIIGDGGRLHIREDRGTVALERFRPSKRFAGYDQLAEETIETCETLADMSPFVAIANDVADLARDPALRPLCGASEALEVQRALAAMEAIAAPKQGVRTA